MTTSGTSTFNLDIGEICEEAFERAGLEMRTGYDLRTARRSLNLLCLEWQNRGKHKHKNNKLRRFSHSLVTRQHHRVRWSLQRC